MARHNPTTRHIGFKAAAEHAAESAGVSEERGAAIIAASAQKSSAKARAANPRLTKVAGVGKNKGAGKTG